MSNTTFLVCPLTDFARPLRSSPFDPSQYLVYGGSSSVGLYTIQLAKLAGYKVIVTASPHSEKLVKSYGADEVVDVSTPVLSRRPRVFLLNTQSR